jgi:ubiquinone/menaquinone biosynthesis C-methylase UbiE
MEQGNAQTLKGLRDCSFDFVYSGHTLEHMEDPALALKNWWRVVTVGGYLILYVPHRDLYEKKKTLPSQWNPDHKHFFLPDHDDPPDTLGLQQLIQKTISNYKVEYSRVCDEGYESFGNDTHSKGEYSIEIVLKKTGITCAE